MKTKIIALILCFVLIMALCACNARKNHKEEEPTADNKEVEQQEAVEGEQEELEIPQMPWIDEPIETPIIPLDPVESTDSDKNAISDSESEESPRKEDFYDGIVPELNELPPIPIN